MPPDTNFNFFLRKQNTFKKLQKRISSYLNEIEINRKKKTFVRLFNYRKARRKERDGDQNSGDAKLYLEENVLERKLPDADLKMLVDLPAGLDYNEWLASHSKCIFFFIISQYSEFVLLVFYQKHYPVSAHNKNKIKEIVNKETKKDNSLWT